MAMRWYVIHVYSGSEKKVAQSIEEQVRQAGYEDLIEEVLVPTEEVVEMRAGQKRRSEAKVVHRQFAILKLSVSFIKLKRALSVQSRRSHSRLASK